MSQKSLSSLHVSGDVTNQVLGDVGGDTVGGDKVMGNSRSGIFFSFNIFDSNTDYDDLPFMRFLQHDSDENYDDEAPILCLPLTAVDMFCEVYGPVSRVSLRQTFVNSSPQAIEESSYALPLHGGSTLISFKFTINGNEVLHSTVQPRSEAAELFQETVADAGAAALLEAKAPEVFHCRFGIIPAQSRVEVETVYINQLRWDTRGNMSLTIPTWIAPKYKKSSYDNSIQYGEGVLRIRVKFFADLSICKVFCPTHFVLVETGENSRAGSDLGTGERTSLGDVEVSFLDYTPVLKDNLSIEVTARALASQSHAIWEDLPDAGPALLVQFSPRNLFPQHSSMDYSKTEFVFVVNRSRSMTIGKLEAARQVLQTFLSHLPGQSRFNIHSFASDFSSLWKDTRPNSSESFNTAMQHVETFEIGLGESKILQALTKVVGRRTQSLLTTQIIILTDEQFSEEKNEVLHFIDKCAIANRGQLRFFCLGIGCTALDRFAIDLGRVGGGFGSTLPMKNEKIWQRKAFEMIQGAMSPWKFQVSLPDGPGTPTILDNQRPSAGHHRIAEAARRNIIQAPYILDAVNPFEWTTVYLMCPTDVKTAPSSLTIQAMTLACETVQASIPIKESSFPPSIVHQLAARAILNDIDHDRSWLHAAEAGFASNGRATHIVAHNAPAIAEEAKRLGLEWSIPGKWTSLVAVRDEDDHSDPRFRRIHFPVPTRLLEEEKGKVRTRSKGPSTFAFGRDMPANPSSAEDEESSSPETPVAKESIADADNAAESDNFTTASLPRVPSLRQDVRINRQQEYERLYEGYIRMTAAFQGYLAGIKAADQLTSNVSVLEKGNRQTLYWIIFCFLVLFLFLFLILFLTYRLPSI